MIEVLLDLYEEKFGKKPSTNIVAGKDTILGELCLNALKSGKEITDEQYSNAYKGTDINWNDKKAKEPMSEEELEKETKKYLQSIFDKGEKEETSQASKLFDVDLTEKEND